jgi:hypothetical protein
LNQKDYESKRSPNNSTKNSTKNSNSPNNSQNLKDLKDLKDSSGRIDQKEMEDVMTEEEKRNSNSFIRKKYGLPPKKNTEPEALNDLLKRLGKSDSSSSSSNTSSSSSSDSSVSSVSSISSSSSDSLGKSRHF